MCSIKHFVFPGYPGAAQINLARTVQPHNCPALLLAHSDWQYFNPNPRRCHLLVHAPTPLQCVPKQEMRVNSRKRRGKHSINFEYLGQMSAYSGFGSTPPTALRWHSSCVKADQTVSTCCLVWRDTYSLMGFVTYWKWGWGLGKDFVMSEAIAASVNTVTVQKSKGGFEKSTLDYRPKSAKQKQFLSTIPWLTLSCMMECSHS